MTLLDYTIDGKHVEYPVADSQMKKFLRKQLTNEEIAEIYIDNYLQDETQEGIDELNDMYPEGITVENIKDDADNWILDILVNNAYDFVNDDSWRELMLNYFHNDAIAYSS